MSEPQRYLTGAIIQVWLTCSSTCCDSRLLTILMTWDPTALMLSNFSLPACPNSEDNSIRALSFWGHGRPDPLSARHIFLRTASNQSWISWHLWRKSSMMDWLPFSRSIARRMACSRSSNSSSRLISSSRPGEVNIFIEIALLFRMQSNLIQRDSQVCVTTILF